MRGSTQDRLPQKTRLMSSRRQYFPPCLFNSLQLLSDATQTDARLRIARGLDRARMHLSPPCVCCGVWSS